jgi:hypothetical protein
MDLTREQFEAQQAASLASMAAYYSSAPIAPAQTTVVANAAEPEPSNAFRSTVESQGVKAVQSEFEKDESSAVQTQTSALVTDEEITSTIVKNLKEGKSDPEITDILEFYGLDDDAERLIKRGHERFAAENAANEKEIEAAHESEDSAIQMREEAGKLYADTEFERKKLWLENYCLKKVWKMPVGSQEIEKYARYYEQVEREQAERDAEPEEEFNDSKEEPFPESPIFPGALTDLARALYPSLPLEFKQIGLIVRWGLMRSGLDLLENEPHLQPRFYTVLVSPPNRGKSACINESRNAMKLIQDMVNAEHNKKNSTAPHARMFAEIENLTSADSGPFLVQEFYDKAKEANKQYIGSVCAEDRAKILLDPDELSDVFEKARTSSSRVSTLFIELLKLHSNNRTGNGTKQNGNRPVENAHLAILAGTTTKKYPMLWMGTGGGADGLVSRFIAIATNAEPVPPVPLATLHTVTDLYKRLIRLAQLPGQKISLSRDAAEMLVEWWNSFDRTRDSAARILEMVKQLLIVLAVTNAPEDYTGTELTVGPDLMQHAIKFGDYEISLRERLNPGDSWGLVQAQEQAIIKWAQKHASRKSPKSKNEFRRGIAPHRLPGGLGTFLFAWKNCVGADVIKLRDKQGRAERYSL